MGQSRRLLGRRPPCKRGRIAIDVSEGRKNQPKDDPRCHNYLWYSGRCARCNIYKDEVTENNNNKRKDMLNGTAYIGLVLWKLHAICVSRISVIIEKS